MEQPTLVNVNACRAGIRTDFVVNVDPSKDPKSGDIIRKNKIRLIPKSQARYESYTKQKDLEVYLPSAEVLERGMGAGSGSTALVVAISLCRRVDMLGFGVFVSNDSKPSAHYLHFYDKQIRDHDHGHINIESELRSILWHSLGIINYIAG